MRTQTTHPNKRFYDMVDDPQFAWIDHDILVNVTPETDVMAFGPDKYAQVMFVKHSPAMRRVNALNMLHPIRSLRSRLS